MKRVLLTIVLLAAVSVATGACRGAAEVGNPYTRKTNTVKPRKAMKCKTCTVFKCETPKKRKNARK